MAEDDELRPPLSVRDGKRSLEDWAGPHDDVPRWSIGALLGWLDELEVFEKDFRGRKCLKQTIADDVRNYLRIVRIGETPEALGRMAMAVPLTFLGILEFLIKDFHHSSEVFVSNRPPYRLREILTTGGSPWTVDEDGRSLVRRISTEATEAYERLTQQLEDSPASHLGLARKAIYGRDPNPKLGINECQCAVEGTLKKLVASGKNGANHKNLGIMLGHITERERPKTSKTASRWQSTYHSLNKTRLTAPLLGSVRRFGTSIT